MKKMMIRRTVALLPAVFMLLALATVAPAKASPGITTFFDYLDGFNAAAGFPAIVVNFDDIAPGTDITNQTIGGVTFEPNLLTTSAALIVVRANDTYTPAGFNPPGSGNNTLLATSGDNVLSPGGQLLGPGPNATLENDDLTFTFTDPVSAVGFDILFQSLDPASYTTVTLLNASGSVLYQNTVPTHAAPDWDCGTVFVGFVSDAPDIAKVLIDEKDSNAQYPDCNIGFDTLRFGPGDTTPPDLGLPSQTPLRDNVQPDQNVTVAVNATDVWSGIKNVTLFYSFNNGTSWEDPEVMAFNSSRGLFEAVIPGQPADAWVQFKIVAFDNAGNSATVEGSQPYLTYQVIPELPSVLMLPLFLTATLLAARACKRKRADTTHTTTRTHARRLV